RVGFFGFPHRVQTVELSEPTGDVVLAFSFFPDSTHRLSTRAAIEHEMHRAYDSYLSNAVEKSLQIEFVTTSDGLVGYTTLTDRKFVSRDVPQGERLYLTVGIRSWNGVFVVFTLESNHRDSSRYKKALDLVLSGLRQTSPAVDTNGSKS